MGLADYIKNKVPYWPNSITEILLKLNCFGGMCYGFAYMAYPKRVVASTPDEKLISMVNYAIEKVPYYRKRYGSLRIKSRKEFEDKIGFIDKDEVMAHWNEFVADDADMSKCYEETTGGTSGKPMKFLSPKNRYVREMYFWHKLLKRFGWNYDTVGVIRNHRIGKGRDYMVNPIMKHVIFDGFRTDDEYYRNVWSVIRRKKIKYLYCYPAAAYSFLKFCFREGLDTSFIKACFLTSETVTEYQRSFIQDTLGIDIVSSYGHSEKLCLAGTVPDHLLLYNIEEEYGLTELIEESGTVITQKNQLGEIVGTTFSNYYFPLIRYRTGDYSSYSDISPACRLLGSIQGRWNKSQIIKNDGSTVSVTALNLHGDFNDKIRGLQYIQTRKGYLTALIIRDKGYGDAEHRFFLEHIANAMGGDEYVEIQYVDKLVYQPNGKFLPFITYV